MHQVPQQPNGSDCGYYALHFAKAFLEDPEKYRNIIWVRLLSAFQWWLYSHSFLAV